MRVLIFNVLLISTCFYAFVRGGAPERIVGGLFLAAAIISVALSARIADLFGSPAYGLFCVDLVLLACLTCVALRANRGWTMTVAAMQLIMTSVHLARIVNPDTIRWVYAVMLALWSWPMVLALAFGTYRHRERLSANGADPPWSG
ncbi:hypothetical protein [Sphingomonas sp. PAMC 26617]|uniref:hypothetical protein n=1 Tax=Sphingomonas sp. PAMC 26617 TaxID=1112216 RepID=UPI00028898EF|nr:hypothetical protein [Sphingomonas sp. PAMC 26617]